MMATPLATQLALSDFELTRVLCDDPHSKVTILLGRKQDQDGVVKDAVVLLKRRHFDTEFVSNIASSGSSLKELYVNDVYHQYLCKTPEQYVDSTLDLIFPATAKHIQKYSDQERVMVRETAAAYKEVVEPYIKALPPARVEWIYNILDKQSEVERVIFDDPDPTTGFVLLPDMKWDCINMEQLYCLALCVRRDLHTLRDLTAAHLPMLISIRDNGTKAIQERYGVLPSHLRVYVHYHPTYYHFHVHFAHLKLQGPATLVGKAFLLDDIIENIGAVAGDYYQQRTLSYSLGVQEELAPLVLPAAT